VSDQPYAMKPLEAASELLSRVLRLGSEGGGLEVADGGGGGVFDGMVGYRVEELTDSRVEDGSSECCTCVSSS
jgi:hypothetical protein